MHRRPLLLAAALVMLVASVPVAAGAAMPRRVLLEVDPGARPSLGPDAAPAVEPEVVSALERRAGAAGLEIPDLARWYRVPAASALDAARTARALDGRPGVSAEVAAQAAPPPAACAPPPPGGWPGAQGDGRSPDLSAFQDLRLGLGLPDGADGFGVRLADVEFSWLADHEDLAGAGLEQAPGPLAPEPAWWPETLNHGTAVLGLLGARADGRGVTGLAPGAQLRAVSPVEPGGAYDPAGAIARAAAAMRPGDVMLVELQADLDPSDAEVFVPIEASPDVRDAIRAAVALGITVVEPAGNSGLDLASLGKEWLTGAADASSSGALVVGAGGAPGVKGGNLARSEVSNYGTRVDLQGDGEGLVTTGYGDLFGPTPERTYTACFQNTSAAAAGVAGGIAVLQGYLRATGRPPLTPSELRERLIATGLPQDTSVSPGHIGPRPQIAVALGLPSPSPGAPAPGSPLSPASSPGAGPATAARVPAPTPAQASPANGDAKAKRPTVRGIVAMIDRSRTLHLRLRGLVRGTTVRVAGRRVLVRRGRVTVWGVRTRTLLVRATPPSGRARKLRPVAFRLTVPARRAGTVRATSLGGPR